MVNKILNDIHLLRRHIMKRNGTIRTTIHALKFCKKNLGKYIGADHNRWITNVAVVMSQALKRQTLVGLGLGPGLSPLLKAGPQARPREEGRRFQLFWWISHPKYCLNILVIEPHSDRDLMVLWARAPGFKARHFVVLWFNPQPGQFFFHKIYFPLFIIFFFYLWKILLLCFLKNFQF